MSATDDYPTTPPPIITTTTYIPYPTSQQQPQPGSFSGSGLSTPLLAGSISVGAFGLAIIAICVWFKYMGRNSPDTVVRRFVERMLPARVRQRRLEQFEEEEAAATAARQRRRGSRQSRRGRGSERGRRSRARPRMFDAWIETVDDAMKKWEAGESVPLAARVFTRGSSSASSAGSAAAGAAWMNEAEVSSRAGGSNSICEEKDEEKQMRQGAATGSSTTLQVAVLLQMPSPPARHTVTDAQNDISVRDELVLGLVEAPWTREHPSSREGDDTTTNPSHT